MKVMVIAPHPDDETLGAGGTLLKHLAAGDEVHWCLVTHAFADAPEPYIRQRVALVSELNRMYGFAQYHLLGYPAAALDTVPMRSLVDSLRAVADRIRPEMVYSVGPGDVNSDHDVVYRAVMIVTKPVYAPYLREILLYEVPSSTNWAYANKSALFNPNVYVDISQYLERKLEIMSHYVEAVHSPPHPRSREIVRAWAVVRGSNVSVSAAECFQLVRRLWL